MFKVPVPPTSLIHSLDALKMLQRDGFENSRIRMTYTRVMFRVSELRRSLDKERLQDVILRNSMKDRKVLGPELHHSHRPPLVILDFASHTEHAGVVDGVLQKGYASSGQKQGSR